MSKERRRGKLKGAGPGRPKNAKPSTNRPKKSVEDLRDNICKLAAIERHHQDIGKPLKGWELAQLQTFLLLTIETLKDQQIDPLKEL